MTPPGDKSPFVFACCWCFVRQEPGQGCGGAEPGVRDPSTAPRPVQGPAVLGTGCRALWLASPKHLRVPQGCAELSWPRVPQAGAAGLGEMPAAIGDLPREMSVIWV